MKKILIFTFLAIMLKVQVFAQDSNCIRKYIPNLYGLDSKELSLWRKDKMGCFGYRDKYITQIQNNQLLIGMPQKLFFILFGSPDVSNDTDNIFIYYCGCKCDKKLNHLENSEVIQVILRFSNGKLIDIGFSMT